MRALREFGAPLMGLTQKDLETPECAVIGLDALIANKRAAGRPQDLADVAALEKIRAKAERR